MVGHGGSSASSYLADPTSPIPSHCASIIVTSTLRVKYYLVPGLFLTLFYVLAVLLVAVNTNTIHKTTNGWGDVLRGFCGCCGSGDYSYVFSLLN